MAKAHDMLPDMTHDEAAQQAFAAALRGFSMTVLERGNKALCERELAPAVDPEGKADRSGKQAVLRAMERRPEHQLWHRFMQDWQELLWYSAIDCVERQLDGLVERADDYSAKAKGSLTLNSDIEIPGYQQAVDNHHFPGGYCTETRERDVRQGAVLDRAASTYLGDQLGGQIHDARGRTLVAHVRERWPGLRPRRILDLGCMTGTSTLPWVAAFPEAEVHAIDTSAPVLRYAHARAEALGAPVHFHQQNAERTSFEDESLDLVVSHVFLHETSAKAVPRIFEECRRLLRLGGVMAHLEVPVRAELLGYWDYIRSAREGRYNQEPYWIGVTSADLAAIAREAGFRDVAMGFQDVPTGAGGGAPGFKPLNEGKFALSNWFIISGVR